MLLPLGEFVLLFADMAPCWVGFYTHTHLDISQHTENCFQSNFCRWSDPWNGAKSFSSPQRYAKAADCLIQPPILTLWPPLNTLASLPQYSWAENRPLPQPICGIRMRAGVYVGALKFEREWRCVCVCGPVQGCVCMCVSVWLRFTSVDKVKEDK